MNLFEQMCLKQQQALLTPLPSDFCKARESAHQRRAPLVISGLRIADGRRKPWWTLPGPEFRLYQVNALDRGHFSFSGPPVKILHKLFFNHGCLAMGDLIEGVGVELFEEFADFSRHHTDAW